MYQRKRSLVAFACVTRLVVLVVQSVANAIIPDHNAEVFLYPKTNLTSSFSDETVTLLFGGFLRWDAQYFMHIAKYGYTYENTLAFFPLYPLLSKITAAFLSYFVIFLNEDSILLLTFVFLNVYLFIKSVLTLYELGIIVLTEDVAYKSAVLFCINPATIFFIAPYSESLFSYLSFKSMLNCVLAYNKYSKSDETLRFKSIINVVIPVALSTCVRSNGILNIGFMVYFMLLLLVQKLTLAKAIKIQAIWIMNFFIVLIFITLVCLIPFTIVQIYDYYIFCTNFPSEVPSFLVDFANINNLVLPGMVEKYKQAWCFKAVPLAYSYIQDHYWNVGFLRYFEFKQIPNFILAFPIVLVIVANSLTFIKLHRTYCMNLGIFRFKFRALGNYTKSKTDPYFKQEMFVFVIHALFLTLFCVMCIHVQVTTRMICSASPVVYWFASYYFKNSSNLNPYTILYDGWNNSIGRYVIYYFVSYCFLGTVLFCNFLPWT